MRERHGEISFVIIVISVIVLLFIGGLAYIQKPQISKSPILVKQLAIRTQICACPNLANGDGTIYLWEVSLTNEGRTPIIAINTTLDMSAAIFFGQDSLTTHNHLYALNQFLISQEMGPPATNFVRNPPLPIVSPTIPLLLNYTASNSMILFQGAPYLQFGQSFPIAIKVMYANGTLSNLAISAKVVAWP